MKIRITHVKNNIVKAGVMNRIGRFLGLQAKRTARTRLNVPLKKCLIVYKIATVKLHTRLVGIYREFNLSVFKLCGKAESLAYELCELLRSEDKVVVIALLEVKGFIVCVDVLTNGLGGALEQAATAKSASPHVCTMACSM